MYTTIASLLDLANTRGVPLWEIVLENEMDLTESSREQVFARLEDHYHIMAESAKQALEKPLETVGGLIQGISCKQSLYAANPNSITGPFINTLMARALSCSEVNASMGKICAAPTAGSCGILPAVLLSTAERFSLPKQRVLEGILTASGLGAVVMKNATVAGAEGGCQAECGVAAAMSAAAAVQMAGGRNETALHAFSLALMNCMGLVCDPIAGLVQVPCAQRNASQAVNAVISADMALAGMECLIPPDEMVEALYRVGRMLPEQLRETAMGGIAATPTGKKIARQIYEK